MTSNPRAGTRIPGSLRSADGNGIVRMQDGYDTDTGDLWSALTEPRRLARRTAEADGDLRPAESSAHALPANGKAPGARKHASPRCGCRW